MVDNEILFLFFILFDDIFILFSFIYLFYLCLNLYYFLFAVFYSDLLKELKKKSSHPKQDDEFYFIIELMLTVGSAVLIRGRFVAL